MPFPPPNQQRQSTEGNTFTTIHLNISLGIHLTRLSTEGLGSRHGEVRTAQQMLNAALLPRSAALNYMFVYVLYRAERVDVIATHRLGLHQPALADIHRDIVVQWRRVQQLHRRQTATVATQLVNSLLPAAETRLYSLYIHPPPQCSDCIRGFLK